MSPSRLENLDFTPVWVSSREHLTQFQQIRKSTPWYRLLFGRGGYDVPTDFPHMTLPNGFDVPLVYKSVGNLAVRGSRIRFVADPALGSQVAVRENLGGTEHFSVDLRETPPVGRFCPLGVGVPFYKIDWIDLVPHGSGTSCLLCVGAYGSGMGEIQRRTDELYEVLAARSASSV